MVKSSISSKTKLASIARSDELRASFTSAAIGMGWQLALVVLIPIVSGYKLDSRFGFTPWLTLLGLVVALVGSILVIRRALSVMNNFNVDRGESAPEDKS